MMVGCGDENDQVVIVVMMAGCGDNGGQVIIDVMILFVVMIIRG